MTTFSSRLSSLNNPISPLDGSWGVREIQPVVRGVAYETVYISGGGITSVSLAQTDFDTAPKQGDKVIFIIQQVVNTTALSPSTSEFSVTSYTGTDTTYQVYVGIKTASASESTYVSTTGNVVWASVTGIAVSNCSTISISTPFLDDPSTGIFLGTLPPYCRTATFAEPGTYLGFTSRVYFSSIISGPQWRFGPPQSEPKFIPVQFRESISSVSGSTMLQNQIGIFIRPAVAETIPNGACRLIDGGNSGFFSVSGYTVSIPFTMT